MSTQSSLCASDRPICVSILTLRPYVVATWQSCGSRPSLPRIVQPQPTSQSLAGLLELVIDADADSARSCLRTLAERIRSGEVDPATVAELKKRPRPAAGQIDRRSRRARSPPMQLWSPPCGKTRPQPRPWPALADSKARQRSKSGSWPWQTLVFAKDPAAHQHCREILARRDAAARPTCSRQSSPPCRAPTIQPSPMRCWRPIPQLAAESQPRRSSCSPSGPPGASRCWTQIAAQKIAAGRAEHQPGPQAAVARRQRAQPSRGEALGDDPRRAATRPASSSSARCGRCLAKTPGDRTAASPCSASSAASATRFTARGRRSAPTSPSTAGRRTSSFCRTSSIRAWSSARRTRPARVRTDGRPRHHGPAGRRQRRSASCSRCRGASSKRSPATTSRP